ncbi:hypothetical protein QZH41_002183 [Actinostola sp. cb2023]|nr:hypothetical protein QZH41_002183 [Actinostola sp. cb2023]
MIEETSKESCDKWRKKEKRRGKGVGMKASYDAGWQKQGRAHNSRTGQGTMVGLQTGKCLDGTKNAYCRKCFEAEKRGADPKPHDCRLNHVGSAKAMESSIAIEICQKDQYQVIIGDDNSTVISRLRAEVNSNLEKWSDINHATCTLTKALYEGRGRNFGPGNQGRESRPLCPTALEITRTVASGADKEKTLKHIDIQRCQAGGTYVVTD